MEQEVVPTRQEINDFYLAASRETYAADMPKGTIVDLPGSKVYRYERDPWLFVDMYFSHDGKSFGQIVIYYADKPVMGFQYSGWWDTTNKDVIPFLKQALMTSFARNEFNGGRGPKEICLMDGGENDDVMYQNEWEEDDDGNGWHGEEDIYTVTKDLFVHYFRGIYLV